MNIRIAIMCRGIVLVHIRTLHDMHMMPTLTYTVSSHASNDIHYDAHASNDICTIQLFHLYTPESVSLTFARSPIIVNIPVHPYLNKLTAPSLPNM